MIEYLENEYLAPNPITRLYSKYLADHTVALTADDIRGGVLPTVLPSTGVGMLVNGLPGIRSSCNCGRQGYRHSSLWPSAGAPRSARACFRKSESRRVIAQAEAPQSTAETRGSSPAFKLKGGNSDI
jgi:hypothetical protein